MRTTPEKPNGYVKTRRSLLHYKMIRYAVHVEKKKKTIVCVGYVNLQKSEGETTKVRRKKERIKVDAYVLGTILVT